VGLKSLRAVVVEPTRMNSTASGSGSQAAKLFISLYVLAEGETLEFSLFPNVAHFF
jgi:hypothetical protein